MSQAEADQAPPRTAPSDATAAARDVAHTHCCIVGGGPGGVVLGLLLARNGIRVTLLEEHLDFDRDFRGDSLHPATMELMDQLGLADRLLRLRHAKVPRLALQTDDGPVAAADFGRLRTKFPYITFMPQPVFLQFVVDEAKRYSSFRLVMGASVQALIEEQDARWPEDGVVRGVRYRSSDGWHEVRAPLTIGADGRFSRVRQLAGIEMTKTSPPMDILWFKVPRAEHDPEETMGRVSNGHIMVMINRFDHWQLGCVIPKGTYRQIHDTGLTEFTNGVAALAPWLADRVRAIADWRRISVLSVESSMARRWYKPGLLLIGDAAHVMSPVMGVGINYAIQDAVAATNALTEPLRAGQLRLRDLAAVQRRRELPTRFIQAVQSAIQTRIFRGVSNPTATFRPPRVLGLPLIRDLPARLAGYGIRPERLAW